jgi:hypothetical protein
MAPQRLLHTHSFEERRPYDKDFVPVGEGPEHTYYLAVCSVCHDALLYISTYNDSGPAEFPFADLELLYPADVELDHSVPARVRECYSEAVKVQHNAPNAYAVLVRRALESICEDRGIMKGALKTRLQKLVDRGEIPPNLVESTTILRTIGNEGAHGQNLSPYITWAMADLFKAIVEYVYVAPDRVERYKRSAETYLEQEEV